MIPLSISLIINQILSILTQNFSEVIFIKPFRAVTVYRKERIKQFSRGVAPSPFVNSK